MSKCFNMQYGGLIYTLTKKDVKFYNGYGIVLASVYTEDNVCMQAVGVVDKDFKEVIPLTLTQMLPELEVVPNGTFLYRYLDVNTNQYFVWHSDADRGSINLGANHFYSVNDKVYTMEFSAGDALYDAMECKFLTPTYTSIGPFIESEVHKQKVARAVHIIADENGVIDEVDTAISTNGEVLEPFVSLKTGEKIESKNLDEVIGLIVGKAR